MKPTKPIEEGQRIRFTKRLDEPASGDHPAYVYAEREQLGTITRIGGSLEGYWATADGWPHPFGVAESEFEVIE